MKKSFFLRIFVSTQLVLIVAYIHKANRFTTQSYRKQGLELAYKKLQDQHQTLVNRLYVAKNQDAVKDFAQQQLAMTTVNLKQIKTLR